MIANLYARGQDPGDEGVPSSFTWKSPSEIPAANLFNLDEMGSDTNKGRKKKIAHVDCMFDGLKHGMELTDGDNNPFHVTNCLTTCADAITFIPPLLAHSNPSSSAEVQNLTRRHAWLSHPNATSYCLLEATTATVTSLLLLL